MLRRAQGEKAHLQWKESALWDILRKKNGLITQDREKFEQLPEEVNHLF